MMLRSLTIKLTLSFLIVGLIGALLVAMVVGQRTQTAFNQFVVDRGQSELINTLCQYYATHGSWSGVSSVIPANLQGSPGPNHPPLEIVTPDGHVVLSGGRYPVGALVPSAESAHGVPLRVNGTTIGLLLNTPGAWHASGPGTPEGDFRSRLTQALTYGAAGATIIALLIGIVLARTLTHPIRELTAATEVVAKGTLGQQVLVRSRDELGALAASFNRMSTDLAHASTLRRQMTADIAHDLRTPLSVILGYTEALREGKLRGTQDIYDTMYDEAQLLQHLIDDLRTLSLADAGELPLRRQSLTPLALLERVVASHKVQAQTQHITLVLQPAPHLPEVEVDPERMAQVLSNLVSNALHYTSANGTITIAAQTTANAVQLSVADTGAGIAPEDLPYIFERFYRGDASRQHDGSSGLGLAIVKAIVEAHGGTIAVTSLHGHGTTFTITLPTAPRLVPPHPVSTLQRQEHHA